MTATCLNTNGIEAVLRICCCASGSIVFHGRKTTALSFTVSTALKVASAGRSVKGTHHLLVSDTSRSSVGGPFRADARTALALGARALVLAANAGQNRRPRCPRNCP